MYTFKKYKKILFTKTIYEILAFLFPKLTFKDTDIIISSFPKSGRNWLLFLIANSILGDLNINVEVNFHNIHQIIPQTIRPEPTIKNYPRIMATHKKYRGQNGKVIYLIRHPADVMVSLYYYLEGRKNKKLPSFTQFIKTDKWGIPKWKKHVVSWQDEVDYVVRFEDLKENALSELKEVMHLINKNIDTKILKNAVERSTFRNMKAIEGKCGLPYKKGWNNNFRFMRKGKHQKGKTLFTKVDYKYLKKATEKINKNYNYDI
jgi:hypothetical protein